MIRRSRVGRTPPRLQHREDASPHCSNPSGPPPVDAADRRRNVGIVEWTAWFDAPEYEFARQVL